jgi:hypothetical protein
VLRRRVSNVEFEIDEGSDHGAVRRFDNVRRRTSLRSSCPRPRHYFLYTSRRPHQVRPVPSLRPTRCFNPLLSPCDQVNELRIDGVDRGTDLR